MPTATPLSSRKEIVRTFYQEMWNKADISLVAGLMHADVTFRGSLGPQLVGPAAVAGYVTSVTTALGQYTCDILDMTEEDDRIAVRLFFHGLHRGVFMGFAQTGQRVEWAGSAHFTFRDDLNGNVLISDVWVLGDLHALIRQLQGQASGIVNSP
jgi:predicted ester cyclase